MDQCDQHIAHILDINLRVAVDVQRLKQICGNIRGQQTTTFEGLDC